MNLSSKKIFYISALGFIFAITGCGKKGGINNNDSANESTNKHGRALIRKFGRKLIEIIVLIRRTLNEIERISVHAI